MIFSLGDVMSRPILKWPGNKFQCIDKILPTLPEGKRLIEPFTGSAAVFMNTHYPTYLLAESNQDLINLFQEVKKNAASFIKASQNFFSPDYNKKEVYYSLRQELNETPFNQRRALLFLYLNRHGYNGLCRYNKKGHYNVPFGDYTKPYFPFKELLIFEEKSQKASFCHQDFRTTFQKARLGDVIYCDPPYSPIEQISNFTSYTAEKFTVTDHEDLTRLAIEAAKSGIPVIISNHDTPATRAQYHQAKIIPIQVNRLISANRLNRQKTSEIIAIFEPPSFGLV
jgi:DNA adenine methylase